MSELHKCINCHSDENTIPLVAVRFASSSTWICSKCMPNLIHRPHQLQSKFDNLKTENPPAPLED